MGFIQELQQRPEEERFSFALGTAIAVGVVLLIIWSIATFSGGSSAERTTPDEQQASAAEALGSFKNELQQQVGELKTQFDSARTSGSADASATTSQQRAVRIGTDAEGDVQVENIIITNEETDE